MSQPDPIKVRIGWVGDAGIGKTSMIKRISTGIFEDNSPTVGASVTTVHHSFQDKTFEIAIWDTAGQEKFRSLIPMYMRKSDILLLSFDKSSVHALNHWYKLVTDTVNETTAILLIGMKCDLLDDDSFQYEETAHANTSDDYEIIWTSAKTGCGIQLLLDKIAFLTTKIDVNVQEIPTERTEKDEKKSCC